MPTYLAAFTLSTEVDALNAVVATRLAVLRFNQLNLPTARWKADAATVVALPADPAPAPTPKPAKRQRRQIDHTGHAHPATPEARAACRSEIRAGKSRAKADKFRTHLTEHGWLTHAIVRGESLTVKATRDDDTLVVHWDGGVFNYAASSHTFIGQVLNQSHTVKIRNVAEARRIAAEERTDLS